MKFTKENLKPLFIILIVSILSYTFGFYISKNRYATPRNCGEIAISYLEMGKKYYGLNPDNQKGWQEAIDRETFIQNYCLEQFPKQYPWD